MGHKNYFSYISIFPELARIKSLIKKLNIDKKTRDYYHEARRGQSRHRFLRGTRSADGARALLVFLRICRRQIMNTAC